MTKNIQVFADEFFSAIRDKNTSKIVEMCLNGFPADLTCEEIGENNTALTIATIVDDQEVAKTLIGFGADPNAANTDGSTALTHVRSLGLLKLLYSHGASVERENPGDGRTLLHRLVEAQQLELICELVEREESSVCNAALARFDEFSRTPLHCAVKFKPTHLDLAIIDLLLASGASPSAKAPTGKSAIEIAVAKSSSAIVEKFSRQ